MTCRSACSSRAAWIRVWSRRSRRARCGMRSRPSACACRIGATTNRATPPRWRRASAPSTTCSPWTWPRAPRRSSATRRTMTSRSAIPACCPPGRWRGMAARHVPVVLTGEGGDELFAGYPTYLGHGLRGAGRAHSRHAVRAAAIALARRLRPAHHHVTLPFLLERFLSCRRAAAVRAALGVVRHRVAGRVAGVARAGAPRRVSRARAAGASGARRGRPVHAGVMRCRSRAAARGVSDARFRTVPSRRAAHQGGSRRDGARRGIARAVSRGIADSVRALAAGRRQVARRDHQVGA